MREIKFRGYSKELNNWVYGYPLFTEFGAFIIVTDVIWLQENGYKGLEKKFSVVPESVGEYTEAKVYGDYDYEREIYEGDILGVYKGKYCEKKELYKVEKIDTSFGVFKNDKFIDLSDFLEKEWNNDAVITIEGNIFETPELLGNSNER